MTDTRRGGLTPLPPRPVCEWWTSDDACHDAADLKLAKYMMCGYEELVLCRDHADDYGPGWADETMEWTDRGWRGRVE